MDIQGGECRGLRAERVRIVDVCVCRRGTESPYIAPYSSHFTSESENMANIRPQNVTFACAGEAPERVNARNDGVLLRTGPESEKCELRYDVCVCRRGRSEARWRSSLHYNNCEMDGWPPRGSLVTSLCTRDSTPWGYTRTLSHPCTAVRSTLGLGGPGRARRALKVRDGGYLLGSTGWVLPVVPW